MSGCGCWRIRGLKSRRQKPGLFYRRSIAARIALRTGDIWQVLALMGEVEGRIYGSILYDNVSP